MKYKKKKSRNPILAAIIGILLLSSTALLSPTGQTKGETERLPWWTVQSIDTMKYSRDVAREKLHDASFNAAIDQHVREIAETGASHAAIGTPYDEEFVPFLRRWVAAARKYNLNVWFRGNFAGWEKWFGYPRIDRNQHLAKTREFLEKHGDLFVDGDIFTPCPECENGGPGDPRRTGDVKGHREFLIKEYQLTKDLFAKMSKKVASNYASTNGDVARLIMDTKTTQALDGIVTVDHYVGSVKTMSADITEYARQSGGGVVLGEWGAPIPDIHGKMSEEEQAAWIRDALKALATMPEIVGINYWTNRGSSTQLWDQNDRAREAVQTLTSFFKPRVVTGKVTDDFGKPLPKTVIKSEHKTAITDNSGQFRIAVLASDQALAISRDAYFEQSVPVPPERTALIVKLSPERETWITKLSLFIHRLFHRFYNINL